MNLSHFWDGKLGIWAVPVFVLLIIVFIVLSILCFIQIAKAVKEKFSNGSRVWSVVVMVLCLSLVYIKPKGIIDFEKYEGEDLLVASREGAANCTITLKLKDNHNFKEKSVCFGVTEVTGKYTVRNDTIFFTDVKVPRGDEESYEFAVLKKMKNSDVKSLFRYRNMNDTIGNELWITKNELME